MKIIKVKNLSKRIGNNLIIDDISFDVNKGEFISIIGESGVGKTTLLNILSGLDHPSSGDVLINDVSLNSMNEEERTIFRRNYIGIIYQFFNLIDVLDVYENIVLPLKINNSYVNDNYLNSLICDLNLENKLKCMPYELSGGQRQRVAIIRALINKPSIVLCDEPTGNLDKENTDKIIKKLKFFNKRYKQTFLIVTHDLYIASLSDRVLKLEGGKIHEENIKA